MQMYHSNYSKHVLLQSTVLCGCAYCWELVTVKATQGLSGNVLIYLKTNQLPELDTAIVLLMFGLTCLNTKCFLLKMVHFCHHLFKWGGERLKQYSMKLNINKMKIHLLSSLFCPVWVLVTLKCTSKANMVRLVENCEEIEHYRWTVWTQNLSMLLWTKQTQLCTLHN